MFRCVENWDVAGLGESVDSVARLDKYLASSITIILTGHTSGCLEPDPVIMTGRFEAAKSSTAAWRASSSGPGGNDSGEQIDPQAMSLGCTGEKSTS